MSIEAKQQAVIQEFAAITDWEERYKRIIEHGRALAPMDEALKTEKNVVKGCQSTVWMHAALKDGRVEYRADSDAMIVRGLIALLLQVYSGETPSDILRTPPDFIEKTGFMSHLSQTRANGLASMLKQIKLYAAVFEALQKKAAPKA
jgi:cysteine desulfuration protein SufE